MRRLAEPAQPWERIGWRETSLGIAVLVILALVAWIAFSDPYSDVEITGATLEPYSLVLGVSACSWTGYQVDIDESEDGVVRIGLRTRGDSSDDCANVIAVRGVFAGLKVIDSTTGEVVPVSTPN